MRYSTEYLFNDATKTFLGSSIPLQLPSFANLSQPDGRRGLGGEELSMVSLVCYRLLGADTNWEGYRAGLED